MPDWVVELWRWFSRILPGNDEIIKDIFKWAAVGLIGGVVTWLQSHANERAIVHA